MKGKALTKIAGGIIILAALIFYVYGMRRFGMMYVFKGAAVVIIPSCFIAWAVHTIWPCGKKEVNK